MKLKKNIYYSRTDFVKHVCTIVLGRYLYDGSTEISFLELADYLNVTADSLRMRKRDPKVMTLLEDHGIKVKKFKGLNHFVLDTEQFYLVIEEDDDENDTIVI
jgi:hypothetical protein